MRYSELSIFSNGNCHISVGAYWFFIIFGDVIKPSFFNSFWRYRLCWHPPEVYGGEVYGGEVYGGSSYGEPMPFASCADAGVSSGYSAESYGTSTPAPIAYGGGPGGGGGAGPSGPADLPGYAWPSYAAAPNYGALSYPRQHSASAWPYIGPFYPYPQVPLGWRKVTLEWDDGWWHLDFNDK